MPLLTEEEFDPRLASVRLLGWEIAQLASVEAVRTAEEILTRETDEGRGLRMLANMVKGVSFQSTRFEGPATPEKALARNSGRNAKGVKEVSKIMDNLRNTG